MLWTITNHQFNHHPTRVKVMDVVCCHKCCSCLNPPSPLATPWSPTPPCPTTCVSPVPQTQSTALPTRAATLSAMSGQDTPSTWLPNTWNGKTNQKNLTIRIDYVSYLRSKVALFYKHNGQHDKNVRHFFLISSENAHKIWIDNLYRFKIRTVQ